MITQSDFQVPAGLSEGLKMTAICNTCHTGLAAIALLRAAADILCNDFGAEGTCEIIRSVTSEAIALHGQPNAPAGHA
jgi:hypothetical protein